MGWNREGLKVFGVYLGSEGWVSRNWEGTLPAITTRLARWRWILSQVSYRGHTLKNTFKIWRLLHCGTSWQFLIHLPAC